MYSGMTKIKLLVAFQHSYSIVMATWKHKYIKKPSIQAMWIHAYVNNVVMFPHFEGIPHE